MAADGSAATIALMDQSSELALDTASDDYGGGDSSSAVNNKMESITLEELMSLNLTNENELDCLFNFLQAPYPPAHPLVPDGADTYSAFCNSTWDGFLCWPTTLTGSTSVLPCFDELNGIKYDTTRKSII